MVRDTSFTVNLEAGIQAKDIRFTAIPPLMNGANLFMISIKTLKTIEIMKTEYYENEFHKWDNSEPNDANFYSKRAFIEASNIERERIILLLDQWRNSEDISINDVIKRIKNPSSNI